MQTTDVGTLVDALQALIVGITPNYTPHQDKRWVPVSDIDAVASGEIRRFYLELVDLEPYEGGIYSPSAIEYVGALQLHTSYGNIRRETQRAMAFDDGRQVWITLATRQDDVSASGVAGLVSIMPAGGWREEDDDQGRYWGAHIYQVRLLAQGVPGA